MPPPKPRSAVYKDSIAAQMTLQSHFAIADNHPSDKSLPELFKLMFHHIPNAGSGAFRGEYYDACNLFARSNEADMRLNGCTLDQLLKSSATQYYSGEALWRKAQECKRKLLNDIHTAFCQEVCRGWPTVPSGTTTLDPLILVLCQVLWNKKAQELKDGRKMRAETKAQGA